MTLRRQMKERMVRNLQEGKEYGKDFWHPTKQDILVWRHGRRHK